MGLLYLLMGIDVYAFAVVFFTLKVIAVFSEQELLQAMEPTGIPLWGRIQMHLFIPGLN